MAWIFNIVNKVSHFILLLCELIDKWFQSRTKQLAIPIPNRNSCVSIRYRNTRGSLGELEIAWKHINFSFSQTSISISVWKHRICQSISVNSKKTKDQIKPNFNYDFKLFLLSNCAKRKTFPRCLKIILTSA